MDSHCGRSQEGNIWWDFTRSRALGSFGCSSELKEQIMQARMDDEFDGNTIRHSMMTKLRQEGASLEQVNEFTKHAPGSSVVDRFYNKQEKAVDLGVEELYAQYMEVKGVVMMELVGSEGDGSAMVDGDQFGSNPLVAFETEPDPINHCTMSLMKLKVSNTLQIQLKSGELQGIEQIFILLIQNHNTQIRAPRLEIWGCRMTGSS
ncbi:MAG: hypothetical protein EZS28_030524 [Streblomastix strix]|uniref:Tyr recombinase domain-containing protein n=1 Tax=Streblomastix strix TaxID=222440 RepID=A0A5J4UU34_9EUKA|nr:MAG: hypothetical protein EZS28_030524 [Streblomastix strix]